MSQGNTVKLNTMDEFVLRKLDETPQNYVGIKELLNYQPYPATLSVSLASLSEKGYIERTPEGNRITESGAKAIKEYLFKAQKAPIL
jgi:hypothetical protein